MADILKSAQPTDGTMTVSPPDQQPAEGSPPLVEPQQESSVSSPVPPEPPPAPMEEYVPAVKPEPVKASSFDSLIVPRVPEAPKKSDIPDKAINTGSNIPSGGIPKRRKSKVGVILAVILLLLITLPLAVYFISQQQESISDVRSRASGGVYAYVGCCRKSDRPIDINTCHAPISEANCKINTASCYGPIYEGETCATYGPVAPYVPTPTGTSGGCTSIKNYSSSTNMTCNHYNGSQITDQGTFKGTCAFYHCPNGCTGTCGESDPDVRIEFGPCNSGKLASNECGQIDTVDTNNTYCGPVGGCDALIQCGPSCTGGTGETNTVTPIPTGAPQCTRIRIYKDGTDVTNNPSVLRSRDIITITVNGANSTKSHVRVNGGEWKETTTNSNGVFTIDNILLPTTDLPITIEAETLGSDNQWY